MTLRRMVCGLIAVVAMAGLAACTEDAKPNAEAPPLIVPGGPGEPAKTLPPGQRTAIPSTQPNAADVTFISKMIVHHQQALNMAALVPDRSTNTMIKGVAARIADSQRPEIDAMNAWLRQHGQEHAGHNEDHSNMPGMATSVQLDELASAKGADFDALFLQLMIAHHQGAVTMSQEIQNKGADQRVQELADEVIAIQSGEISRMQGMVGH
jgi:uncharacterized protein (DUF305 family)